MATRSEPLDSRIRVVTPENIAFEYRVAGPFWRLPAYLIDLAIRLAAFASITTVAALAFGFAGLFGMAFLVMLLLWFVLAWFYGGLFETFWNGQTPGKRVMQLRVIRTDGRPINALQAILRNILRVVDALPAFVRTAELVYPTYLLGLVVAACSSRYQRLGDLACGTMVVIEERARIRGVERFDEATDQAVDALAAAVPASWTASRSLARALSQYVERRKYFGRERRKEIARHVGNVLVERLRLPADTNHDVLLCTLYRRTFLDDDQSDTPNDLLRKPTELEPVPH